jgi:hypothetical protein
LKWLAVSAVLFVVSDILVGMRLLRDADLLLMGDLIWVLEIIGQGLIVFSVGTALQLPSEE